MNSFLFLHLLYIGLFLFSNEGIVDFFIIINVFMVNYWIWHVYDRTNNKVNQGGCYLPIPAEPRGITPSILSLIQ